MNAFGSLYVGKPQDTTAAALYCPKYSDDEDDDRGALFVRFFMTRENYEIRVAGDVNFEHWANGGWFEIVEGNYIGTEEHVKRIGKYFSGHSIHNVCYRAGDEAVGVALCEKYKYKQRRISLRRSLDTINATRHFENLINKRDLQIEGNPLLSYQVGMAEVDTKDDNTTLSAQMSGDNICGLFAAVMAVHGDYVKKEETSVNLKRGVHYFPNVFGSSR